jgi:outer membrane protein assembly factor BamB
MTDTTAQKPLRLWPGVVLAVLQILCWFILPRLFPDGPFYGLFAFVLGGLLIIIWWLLLSRARWFDRLGAVLVGAIALYATTYILHVSVARLGMGRLFPMLAPPVLSFVFVAALVASRGLASRPRRAVMCAVLVLGSAGWALLRAGGIGLSGFNFAWRWSQTPEERLLAQTQDEPIAAAAPAAAAAKETSAANAGGQPAAPTATPSAANSKPAAPAAVETAADWPGFRGPQRDGVVPGVRIETNWSASPPVKLWQRAIGPGWSSFAARGDLLYTQEQRGGHEIVACYNLTTGQPVWMHRDATRFWDAEAGAGPRGTPTLSKGRVYTLGGTGIVNALDAGSGAVVWTRNVAADTDTPVPYWGFASSPLAVDDLVIVAASGRLIAYDAATGNPRWLGPKPGGGGFSSPHLLTIGGVAQVLLMNGGGAISVSPADGKVLWEHAWPAGSRIVQPALTADGNLLMTVGGEGMGGEGLGSLAITQGLADGTGAWTVKERWTTRGLKPNFNDFVVHEGHAYGFDGNILSCIDLNDGTRKWKGGRYGNGQMVLLPDQDVLLVLSEEGELVLVSATSGEFKELARVPAITGKSWNHPALVGDVLLVRNDQEMAAFRLRRAGADSSRR